MTNEAIPVSSRFSATRRRIERLLLATGLILLLVYIAGRIDAAVMSRAALRSFDTLKSSPSIAQEKGDQASIVGVDSSLWSIERVDAYTQALTAKLGAPLAVLSIPRLQLDVPVFDGTDRIKLNRGAGRIVGTARPGEQGNIGIAAHRDSFFRGLKDLRLGDQIELAVPQQKFVYTVDNIRVIKPSDTSVLRTRSRPSLTLVTCYPFYLVGAASERYIVEASLTNSEPESSGFDPAILNMKDKENRQ